MSPPYDDEPFLSEPERDDEDDAARHEDDTGDDVDRDAVRYRGVADDFALLDAASSGEVDESDGDEHLVAGRGREGEKVQTSPGPSLPTRDAEGTAAPSDDATATDESVDGKASSAPSGEDGADGDESAAAKSPPGPAKPGVRRPGAPLPRSSRDEARHEMPDLELEGEVVDERREAGAVDEAITDEEWAQRKKRKRTSRTSPQLDDD